MKSNKNSQTQKNQLINLKQTSVKLKKSFKASVLSTKSNIKSNQHNVNDLNIQNQTVNCHKSLFKDEDKDSSQEVRLNTDTPIITKSMYFPFNANKTMIKDKTMMISQIKMNNIKITKLIQTKNFLLAKNSILLNLSYIEDYSLSFPTAIINKKIIIFNLYNLSFCINQICNNTFNQLSEANLYQNSTDAFNNESYSYLEAACYHYDNLLEKKYNITFKINNNQISSIENYSSFIKDLSLSRVILTSYNSSNLKVQLSKKNDKIINVTNQFSLLSKFHLQLSEHSSCNIDDKNKCEEALIQALSSFNINYFLIELTEEMFNIIEKLVSINENSNIHNTNSIINNSSEVNNYSNSKLVENKKSNILYSSSALKKDYKSNNLTQKSLKNEEVSIFNEKIKESLNCIKSLNMQIKQFLSKIIENNNYTVKPISVLEIENIISHEKLKFDNNYRSMLGIKSISKDSIDNVDIISFLMMKPITETDLYINEDAQSNASNLASNYKMELKRENLIEKIILLCLSAYIISCKLRNMIKFHNKNEDKIAIEYLAHSFHEFAVFVSIKHLPKQNKLNSIITKHYFKSYECRFDTIENECFSNSQIFTINKNKYDKLKTEANNHHVVDQVIEEEVKSEIKETERYKVEYILDEENNHEYIYDKNQDSLVKKRTITTAEVEIKLPLTERTDEKETNNFYERQLAENISNTTKRQNTIDCMINSNMKLELINTKPLNLNNINLITINSDGLNEPRSKFSTISGKTNSINNKLSSKTISKNQGNKKNSTNPIKSIIYLNNNKSIDKSKSYVLNSNFTTICANENRSQSKGKNKNLITGNFLPMNAKISKSLTNQKKAIIKDNNISNIPKKKKNILHSIFFDSQCLVKSKYKTITCNDSSSAYSNNLYKISSFSSKSPLCISKSQIGRNSSKQIKTVDVNIKTNLL